MNCKEHKIQTEFFRLCELYRNKHKVFSRIFAVPNGGKRDVVTAVKMKREGVKPGVPDVIVICKYATCSEIRPGIVIEFKSEKGRQSESQKIWQEIFEEAGFHYFLCRSALEALEIVENIYAGTEHV